MHQCKAPAQEFFKDELGVDLYVQPNFVSGECQWSWGEAPPSVKEDDAWPAGCLTDCETRTLLGSNS